MKNASTPHDRLMAAIGILQCSYLASQTELDGDEIFGIFNMPTEGVEHAINLLIGVLPALEALEKQAALYNR